MNTPRNSPHKLQTASLQSAQIADENANAVCQRIAKSIHGIARADIDTNACKVVNTLLDAGFDAYLVGGCVRDLLLNIQPKDFDVATNARPEQVVQLFRKSRMIGRRFKIAHVYFGREIIEVSTFRGNHNNESSSKHASKSATGQLLRDNIYGSLAEDALRRDFTVNALYYDLRDDSVLDYAGGFEDIQARLLTMIGDPATRYQEDPVRLLRAIRFSAKLRFSIEKKSAAPIRDLANQLTHVPAARLFDESLKILLSGHGATSYQLLKDFDLFAPLFPETSECLCDDADQFIRQALINTDHRLANGKGITPAFFFAVVLWPALLEQLSTRDLQTVKLSELHAAGQLVISRQIASISIPRRFTFPMRDIWEMQLRLQRRGGKRAERLMEHPRFRAAYDFLLLREECGEDTQALGQWWTDFQAADNQQRADMLAKLGGQNKRRRRGRSRRNSRNKGT